MRTAHALLVAALIGSFGAPLPAQRRADVDLQLPSRPALVTEGPLVLGADLLSDGPMQELLRNGFPARLHYRVELWSVGGWFNDLEGQTEWDVVVRYDPLDRTFAVARLSGDRVTVLGKFDQFADAESAIERPFRAPIRPPGRGHKFYYNVVLDVETLSLGDLDEVERWLRGELRPAVRGERNPGTALTRGVRTLMVRLLGGEKRHYERRSATFRP